MTKKQELTKHLGQVHSSSEQHRNARNRYQGDTKRVLFLCSAGLLRSPTAAHIFSAPPYNWNTRCAGVEPSYALIPVSSALIEWADVIYCMESKHQWALRSLFGQKNDDMPELEDYVYDFYKEKIVPKLHVLNIPDNFPYREEELVKLLLKKIPLDNNEQ